MLMLQAKVGGELKSFEGRQLGRSDQDVNVSQGEGYVRACLPYFEIYLFLTIAKESKFSRHLASENQNESIIRK